MRPKFLPRGRVTTEEPPIEPNEFDEYDQEVVNHFARGVAYVGLFLAGMVSLLAWVSGRVG